jgi:hypothetical protein
MTITIELAPELQAELARQAATQGVAIDACAASLIEDAACRAVATDEPQSSTPSREVFEAIEKLKRFGKPLRPARRSDRMEIATGGSGGMS